DGTCDVVAAAVGGPGRVLIGARDLPGNLIAAGRLLRADRRPAAGLTHHYVRTANFQQLARSAAVVKEKMIPNLGQPGRAIRLDQRRGRTDQSVAVYVLVEAPFESLLFPYTTLFRSDGTCDVVAAAVGGPGRVLIGARDLPGNLIAAGRLLRADRRP